LASKEYEYLLTLKTRIPAMGKRQSGTASAPRKTAVQARSARTVEAIVEAAARILETLGFEGYTTNVIAARAGVSIGSLYQYFPNKDAITLALIAREAAALLEDVRQAVVVEDWHEALDLMIQAAVRHQLRRPGLARLLDLEEGRLAAQGDSGAAGLRSALRLVLERASCELVIIPEAATVDIIGITRGLTDMVGREPGIGPADLQQRLRRALFGYLTFAG
jgi:AcrR family transcriptional regulator